MAVISRIPADPFSFPRPVKGLKCVHFQKTTDDKDPPHMTTDASTLKGNWNYRPRSNSAAAGSRNGRSLQGLGMKRPLLITDPGLAGLPMIKDAVAANNAAGVPTGLFSEVRATRSARTSTTV